MDHKKIYAVSQPAEAGWQGITETGLKWIALVSMLMDHIHYFFGYTGQIPWWFGLAGRLAAPLFLFCLVEGFMHTRSRKRYLFKMLCVSVPMGLLLFFMRFGGILVRPDGFYPQNAMLSSFVILIICFQAFEWIASRNLRKAAMGCGVLLAIPIWPILAGILSGGNAVIATAVGILGYTFLPVINISGDVTFPVLLTGITLYFMRRHRRLQVAALIAVNFGWYFVLVYLQARTWPDFEISQMFTMYYEWLGAVFAAPFLLCYNGRRGAGHGKLFYGFYPAHIYLLYALSWLFMTKAG